MKTMAAAPDCDSVLWRTVRSGAEEAEAQRLADGRQRRPRTGTGDRVGLPNRAHDEKPSAAALSSHALGHVAQQSRTGRPVLTQAETGAGSMPMPIPDPKVASALESPALPPTRTSPETVADLTPPKVHPSKVAVPDQPSRPSSKRPPGPEPPGQITAQPKETPEPPGGAHQIIDKPKGAPPLESQVQGKIGEVRAGIDPNMAKRPIRVDGLPRIPEKVDDGNKLLREVQNVKNLGNNAAEIPALLDHAKWVRDNGYTFELVIDNNTTVGPILKGLEGAERVVIIGMALR